LKQITAEARKNKMAKNMEGVKNTRKAEEGDKTGVFD